MTLQDINTWVGSDNCSEYRLKEHGSVRSRLLKSSAWLLANQLAQENYIARLERMNDMLMGEKQSAYSTQEIE